MSDIVEFLRARLDEDEAVARAAVIPAHEGPNAYKPHPELAEWFYDGEEVEYVQTPEMLAHKYPDRLYVTCDGMGLSPAVDDGVAPHIARHDPARVLREVEAKRRIVERHEEYHSRVMAYRSPRWKDAMTEQDKHEWHKAEARHAVTEGTLCAIAAIYADHPDYDPAWA